MIPRTRAQQGGCLRLIEHRGSSNTTISDELVVFAAVIVSETLKVKAEQ